ncbi:MAG: UDP-N-acetylmuramate dehydrogenase [Cytophagaceae bacterium]|nr:UDP-N-acetylmuramate dehydrogenase [Cytophagaceae bacterium]
MIDIQENVSLRPYNTFGLEVIARYFVQVKRVEDLENLLQDPELRKLPRLLLGGGSNILLTKDFEGLVIRIAIEGIEVVNQDADHVWLRVGAGENWHGLVEYCLAHDYAGFENLSLIPGSVGASPMQNIGAYGVEIKDVFDSLEAIHLETGKRRPFSHAECRFGYRESVFKRELKGQYAIVSVTFRLNKVPRFHLDYGDIRRTLDEMGVGQPSIQAVSEAVVRIRRSKLPDPAELGNAGSFFKNPEIPKAQFDQLKARFPELPGYPTTADQVKVPAGWLIERAGWKGKRVGAVGVHDRQALVLVNYGGGTGLKIKELATNVQNSVEAEFGIRLTPEVNFV